MHDAREGQVGKESCPGCCPSIHGQTLPETGALSATTLDHSKTAATAAERSYGDLWPCSPRVQSIQSIDPCKQSARAVVGNALGQAAHQCGRTYSAAAHLWEPTSGPDTLALKASKPLMLKTL
eukprot:366083-Chlamydomonas_euryale.AAC.2